MISRPIRIATLAVALALTATAPALAASGEVGIEDSGVLGVTQPPSADAPQIVQQWRNAGIDSVRLTAFWDSIAPAGTSKTMPRGFNASNPNSPGYNWSLLDAAVALVRSAGLQPMMTIHETGPRWGSLEPNVNKRGWKPDPKKYAAFATAVATRYRSAVGRYLIGNEPNQGGFMQPQTTCRRGVCDRTGPSMYREMARAAITAVKRADPGSKVLIGELAPIGSAAKNAGSLAPLPFIRGMACLSDNLRRITTGSCKNFKPLAADGFGYHPYTIKTAPDKPNPNKNLAKIGDLKRLLNVIDATTNAHRLRAPGGKFQLFITEFGYETNPPDTVFGVSPEVQSFFLQQAAYIIYGLKSRIPLMTQYLWRDDNLRTPTGQVAGFQTGLLNADSTPKPALATFPDPFFIDTKKPHGLAKAVLWGQVRPGARSTVTIEQQLPGQGSFTPFLAGVSTDSAGYFRQVRAVTKGASYRYTFTNPLTGQAQSSGIMVP